MGPTGKDFLLNELAGALASTDRALVLAAARKSHELLLDREGSSLREALGEALSRYVGDDSAHWLNIAVALYTGMGTPRPTLAQCCAGDVGDAPRAVPAALALSHVTGNDLDQRLLDALLEWRDLNPWGVGGALKDNYWHDPLLISRLSEGFRNDQPGILVLVGSLLDGDRDHPLIPFAVDASLRVVRNRVPLPAADDPALAPARHTIECACWVIRSYGDDDAFAVLLQELRAAQEADIARFDAMWSGCHPQGLPRLLDFCRLGIDDHRVMLGSSRGWRYCDMAAAHLQRETGQDFGWSNDADLARRDAVVAKAKAWLAEH